MVMRVSDLISRQDAIDTVEELNQKVNDGRESDTICTSDVLRRINALPSADIPKGKWIFDDDGYFYCSECKSKPHDQVSTTKFCPNCGSRNWMWFDKLEV